MDVAERVPLHETPPRLMAGGAIKNIDGKKSQGRGKA